MWSRVIIVAVVCLSVVMGSAVIPRVYPLYKQCDSKWSSNQMGTDDSCTACGEQPATVCEQGCAMSCVSMAMNGMGVTIPDPNGGDNVDSNPGSMNAWLHASGGYWCAWGDCNNLMLTSPSRLSTANYNISFVSENEKPALPVLQMWILNDGWIPIAHVRNKTHFVLVTGWDDSAPNTLYVNDPFYSVSSYDYNDVADILLYTVLPPAQVQDPMLLSAAHSTVPYEGPTTGWLDDSDVEL